MAFLKFFYPRTNQVAPRRRVKETFIEGVARKAAEGDLDARCYLGTCYRDGTEGLPKDEVAAAEWFYLAADYGHGGAQRNLGNCYRDGVGVKKNMETAQYWWACAASKH